MTPVASAARSQVQDLPDSPLVEVPADKDDQAVDENTPQGIGTPIPDTSQDRDYSFGPVAPTPTTRECQKGISSPSELRRSARVRRASHRLDL